ncbi:MAG: GNAT family N-acetyltransferase [Gammaproteobacteria bacterium]|nr:GNAT family N-acetyltransferase [Gammaproteobacteria bacterium]MBU2478858.1 GNAT family N-acetyltransferase [Gammaproteobacteria bacterium]
MLNSILDRFDHYIGQAIYLIEQIFSKRFTCHVLTGPEKHSGAPLNILYIGEGNSLDYIKTLFFQGSPDNSVKSHYSLVQILLGVRPKLAGYDLRICEFTPRIMRLIRSPDSFKTPDWIEQIIPLAGSWEEVVARFRKNTRTTDLRKVRKYNFAHDIVTDEESIEYFYDNLYLPYLTQRFGGAFDVIDRDWLISVGKEGGLLRILDGDRVIAGVIFFYGEGYLDWIWTGALTGADTAQENGAFSTLYYHSIQHAHDKGFPAIKLNNTRAFLNDGLHRYKRKWGAHIAKSRSSEWELLLDFNFHSRVTQHWLEASPFLTERDDGFYANIFCFSQCTSEELINHIQSLISPGIKAINIYSTQQLKALPAHIDSCDIHNIVLGFQ